MAKSAIRWAGKQQAYPFPAAKPVGDWSPDNIAPIRKRKQLRRRKH